MNIRETYRATNAIRVELGAAIARGRKKLGLTRGGLSRHIDSNHSDVDRLETGTNVSIDRMIRALLLTDPDPIVINCGGADGVGRITLIIQPPE